MYSPAAFRQDDLATLHQQIRATRLPTLVSQGAQGLLASHDPRDRELAVQINHSTMPKDAS